MWSLYTGLIIRKVYTVGPSHGLYIQVVFRISLTVHVYAYIYLFNQFFQCINYCSNLSHAASSGDVLYLLSYRYMTTKPLFLVQKSIHLCLRLPALPPKADNLEDISSRQIKM